jgi:hypothetical protein
MNYGLQFNNMKSTQPDISVFEIRDRLMVKDDVSKKLTITISELCELHNNQYQGLVCILLFILSQVGLKPYILMKLG